jgi:hypothetical protein
MSIEIDSIYEELQSAPTSDETRWYTLSYLRISFIIKESFISRAFISNMMTQLYYYITVRKLIVQFGHLNEVIFHRQRLLKSKDKFRFLVF